MKRLLLLPILILLFSLGLHGQTVTVTGNLKTVLGESLGSNTFVRFRLRNYKPNRPLVSGVGIIGQTTKDVSPDSNGLISTTVYDNDFITPDGTFYTLEFYLQGRFVFAASYTITGAAFDFNTAEPLSSVPMAAVPVAESRVFTHIQATPATTWTITHNFAVREVTLDFYDASFNRIFPDLVTLTDINTVTALFVVAQTGRVVVMRAENVNLTSSISDPVLKVPTTAQSIAGGFDLSLDGRFLPDSVVTGLWNNIRVVDGIKFTTIASALADCPAMGCDVIDPRTGAVTVSADPFAGITAPFNLYLGPAQYNSSVRWAISSVNNWKILGNGKTIINFTAASPNSDLTLVGAIDNFEITGINFRGTNTIGDAQRGIGSTSNASLAVTDGWLHDLTFEDLKIGITLNAESAGFYRNILVEDITLINIIGTGSGEGYGVTSSGANNEAITFRDIYCESVQRHCIYQAQGRQVIIDGFHIIDHADGTCDGTALHAIKIARSTDVTLGAGTMENGCNGALLITSGGTQTDNINVVGPIVIKNPKTMGVVEIGANGAPDEFLEKVYLSGVDVIADVTVTGNNINLLRVNWGREIKVSGNSFHLLNSTATVDIVVLDAEGVVGTDSGDYELSHNRLFGTENGGTTRGIRLTTALATNNTDLDLHFNKIDVPTASNAVTEQSGLTNTNVTLIGTPVGSLTIAPLKGLITGPLDIQADLVSITAPSGSNADLQILGTSSTASRIFLGEPGNENDGQIVYDNSTNEMTFRTNDGNQWRIDSTGNLIVVTDNADDIGASGANRPRSVYAGTSVIVPRFFSTGTALVAGDIAISTTGAWGDTADAAVSAVTGTDQWFQWTITAGGANTGADPTITITFTDGTWTNAPIVLCNRQDFNAPATVTITVTSVTATVLTLTFDGTPTATNVYKFACHVGGV